MFRSGVSVVAAAVWFVPLAVHAQDDVQARMQEWNKALGVECTHCHLDGQWSLAYLPTFDLAYRMQRMVNDLNAGALKQYGGITCNTCHQGS